MSLNELLEKVRNRGGRITKTRIAILDYLLSAKQPLSSTEIINHLRNASLIVNRTTVYRELAYLVGNGFVREVKLLGKTVLFELSEEHRHHLVCLKCHQVKTLAANHELCQQEAIIRQEDGFKVLDHSLEFYGLCKKCQ
ncbi:MAG: Fur family transcriptional regulator [Patescibacteria group bacterium]